MSVPLHASIILPVLNEEEHIEKTLNALRSWREQGHEVIVADGGSSDETVTRAGPLCDRLVNAPRGRSRQMNAGAEVAGGELLLFLHADTRLPEDAILQLEQFVRSPEGWGRFDVRLSGGRLMFRVISWFINRRSRLTGVATGDQAIFVRRNLFQEIGGYEPVPLMEDVAFSKALLRYSRPFCIDSPVVTDSRRWEVHGTWRTIWTMWELRWRYWRGESPHSLVSRYYGAADGENDS